jgi:hypothetical protein
MRVETEPEFAAYFAENHQYFGLRFDPGPRYGREWFTPFYDHAEARCIGLEFPDFPGGFAYLAGVIPSLVCEGGDAPWRGGAVWYQDYDVWNHQNNVAGWTMIERIRAGYGELRPFGMATVNIFRDNDLSILPAFLLAPLIYGWDAYYIPQERGSFAFISHDGYWTISTETDADFAALQEKLSMYEEGHWMREQRLLMPRLQTSSASKPQE